MKHLITLLSLASLVFLSACAKSEPAPNTLSADEKADGWQLLFDGKSMKGWRGYNNIELQDAWTIQDGVMALSERGDSREQVNIISEAQFADFDLRFEWKIVAGTNSGVMFRVGEGPKKPYHTGPEYQVLDNKGYRSSKGEAPEPEHITASHYAIEAPYSDETKPIGEWNQGRIVALGDHIEYWLNGVKCMEYDINSPKWKAEVAATKFSGWEHYATKSKGHIGLQDHNHPVFYRSIKIKEL